MKRPTLTGFAEACYDQNSVDDLVCCLERSTVDETDCATWKLSHQEWRSSIADALRARIIDRERLPDEV